MQAKTAAQLGAILKNVFNKRMPQAHLPALQPKPIIQLPRPAPKPTVQPVIRPDPVPSTIHPTIQRQDLARKARLDAAEGEWMESGQDPALQHRLEGEMGQLARETQHPALEIRPEGGDGAVRQAWRDKALKVRSLGPNHKPARVQVPAPEPTIRQPPVSPEELTAGGGTAGTIRTTGTGKFRPDQAAQRPLAEKAWRYLTASPGTRAFDHATPAENMLQMLSRPVLTDPNLRRPKGWIRPALLGGAGGAAVTEMASQHK